MNPGSTEVFLALSTALRNQIQIELVIPQHSPIPATIQGLSSDYADIHCSTAVPADSQLQLVRLQIPSRSSVFTLRAKIISRQGPTLRIALNTQGIQNHPAVTEGLSVQTEQLPQLKKVHELLHHIRDKISPWGEHRISIDLHAKTEKKSLYIHTDRRITRAPQQFCFPARPFQKPSQFDIQVPVRLEDRVFGHIGVMLSIEDTIDFPDRLSELSVYAASLAYGLISLPEPSDTSYLLMQSKYGSLYFRSSPKPLENCAYPIPLNNGYCFAYRM